MISKRIDSIFENDKRKVIMEATLYIYLISLVITIILNYVLFLIY